MHVLSARSLAPSGENGGAHSYEILRGGAAIGGMEFRTRDSGRIILDRDLCRIEIPSNQEERNACHAAIDFATGGKVEPAPPGRAPLLLFDSFDRLLAVGEHRHKSLHLHWAEHSCRFKNASLFGLTSRWTLVSASDGVGRGWVGRRSISNDLFELESEIEMAEPVQAFAIWLAARLLSESRGTTRE